MNDWLLNAQGLTKRFKLGNQNITVLDDVSFQLKPGEILGLGGESGSGKSTLGKIILRLIEPSAGSLFFEGENLLKLTHNEMQSKRRQMQMIFQNPASSLNPRMTVEKILAEPFQIHGLNGWQKILPLLEKVGLNSSYLRRLPHELSGGQKQRIAIARALALNPKLLVCDEPFTALDATVQVQIIDLMKGLQNELQLTYLLISHDLLALRYFTHRTAIMYMGKIVEMGPTRTVYDKPLHPYTQGLLSAIPLLDPKAERQRKPLLLKGEIPSLLNPPSGCAFHTRCPFAQPICQTKKPEWRETEPNHFVACHQL